MVACLRIIMLKPILEARVMIDIAGVVTAAAMEVVAVVVMEVAVVEIEM